MSSCWGTPAKPKEESTRPFSASARRLPKQQLQADAAALSTPPSQPSPATATGSRSNPLGPISKAQVFKGKGKGSNIPAAFRTQAFRPHTPKGPKVVLPPCKPSAPARQQEQTPDPPSSSQDPWAFQGPPPKLRPQEPSQPPPGWQDRQAPPRQKRSQPTPASAAPPTGPGQASRADMPFRATGWKNKACWLLASYQAGEWDQCRQMATTYTQELQEQDPAKFVDGKPTWAQKCWWFCDHYQNQNWSRCQRLFEWPHGASNFF